MRINGMTYETELIFPLEEKTTYFQKLSENL